MKKKLLDVVAWRSIIMIEISKKKILEFLGFNMKKIGILISILSGLIFSFSVYAADNNFLISSRCKDEYNSSCNIIRTVNDKSEIIIKDVKLLNILKINKNLYKVKTSCGSPCLVTIFYSKNKEDSTDEFIAIDNENNCLIESDSEKKSFTQENYFQINIKLLWI